MADAAPGDVPSVERTWSASNLLQSFSEAAAAVQPLPANLGRLVEDLQTALVSPSKPNLKLCHDDEVRQDGGVLDRAVDAVEIPPIELRSPDGSKLPSPPPTPKAGTLSVLSAAAASLKDKTQQVAQQQKRALSAFQQKGGLVSWLHGEMEADDEQHNQGVTGPDGKAHNDLVPGFSPPASPTISFISFVEGSHRDDLCTPPSPRSPIESPTTNRPIVDKPVGRRRSMPNIGSGSLLDNFLDKVASVTTPPTAQPTSPPAQSRVKLRPAVGTMKSSPSSFDSFVDEQKTISPPYHWGTSPTHHPSRQRAATTDSPIRLTSGGNEKNCSTSHNLSKARSAAPETRFSLDDILSDEWSCTVLWAYVFSTATGRDHQHHQRLSFLIETSFRITPLYRKLAGTDDTSMDKHEDYRSLVSRLKWLHSRFLMHNGAATLATSGVPVASPAASQAKTQLSVAVHVLTDQNVPDNELGFDVKVEKAVSSLLQLAREVEREFRVLGSKSYANFADSILYREFIARSSGPGNISVLLRAAHIPFYQQPNGKENRFSLHSLTLENDEEAAAVFSRAGCLVFMIKTDQGGPIKFTYICSSVNGKISSQCVEEQAWLLQTIEPFLNPSASAHPAASKPIAFNFTAGSGDNLLYGAVMWVPAHQNNEMGDQAPSGLCIVSRFPLINSLRCFLGSLWKNTGETAGVNEAAMLSTAPTDVENASVDMGQYFLSRKREVSMNQLGNEFLPTIDFQLGDLFDCLSLTNVLRLFAFALLEKKIVMVASSYTILFSVSEALRTLLHPLVWSHVYVPILPLMLKDCLQCPTPFIFGLHDSYVRRSDVPRPSNDLVIVNLDRDSLTGGGDIFLPPVRHSMLREELYRLCKPHLVSRDSVGNFDAGIATSGEFPSFAIRRLFHKHLREILSLLEPCINRFQLNGQSVSVVDNTNASQWPVDTARFCSAMLHTQAVSTYLASPRSNDKTTTERVFM
ncbi:unnamed protein product [Phytophthora lilii]|uniref:Unnamed protein product n=1 Tax=Phytophthora lilii TaxID=2077276 RepID=A0A9W6TDJ3_9STRA|nr:unnamed protein product [Phytophthora lilii]